MFGLYWHFVDIVWIFLFPLLYLIDRSGQGKYGTNGSSRMARSRTRTSTSFPKRVYFAVFFALIVLTWVTALVSTVDLGRWNIFVALAIAIFKASLVVLFFMHV